MVCLNMIDEAERYQIKIDERSLSKELGVPVIPSAARQGEGMDELLKAIHDVATGSYICKPHRIKKISSELNIAVEKLSKNY